MRWKRDIFYSGPLPLEHPLILAWESPLLIFVCLLDKCLICRYMHLKTFFPSALITCILSFQGCRQVTDNY